MEEMHVSVDKIRDKFRQIMDELRRVIVGQDTVMEQMLISLLCDANALLESYPGLGKTTMIKTVADIMNLSFNRIQGTPDLMPSDITGTFIIEETSGKRHFKFQEGPLFANIVLMDEINRATPKTQAALLEAMQEKQVTVSNKTFQLDLPFFVLATQNPIEQEGTYPLPEAQTDRFLFKIKVDYPQYDDELEIVERFTGVTRSADPKKVLSKNALLYLQDLAKKMPISNDLKRRAVEIVGKTRNMKDLIEFGASPRASLGIVAGAKARALLHGRKHVSLEDIENVSFPVLRHRIILNFEAERNGLSTDDVIEKILKH